MSSLNEKHGNNTLFEKDADHQPQCEDGSCKRECGKSGDTERNKAWEYLVLSTHNTSPLRGSNFFFESVESCEESFHNNSFNTNEFDESGYTPVHYAIASGNVEVLSFLIANKGDIHKPTENDNKDTPLHLSIDSGSITMTHFLITNGVDPSQCNLIGQNALMYAALQQKILHLSYLCHIQSIDKNATDIDGNTALHYAIQKGSKACVLELLKYNIDLKKKNREGITPLHIAAQLGQSFVSDTMLSKDITLIRAMDNYRKTPSEYAFETQNQETINVFKGFGQIHKMPRFVQKYRYYTTPISWMLIMYGAFVIMPIWIKILLMLGLARSMAILTQTAEFNRGNNPAVKVGVGTFTILCLLQFLFTIAPYTFFDRPLLVLFSLSLFFVWVYIFLKSSELNPGKIKQKQSDILVMYQDLVNSEDVSKAYCSSCLIKRPERSKHCSKCHTCVLKMDHHCPWIDNCVGEGNHSWFFMTAAIFPILNFMENIIAYGYFFFHPTFLEASGFFAKLSIVNTLSPGYIEMFLCRWFFAIFAFLLCIQHGYFIAKNITNFEFSYWRRYKYMQDERGNFYNRYDKGIINNFKSVFKKGSLSYNESLDDPKLV